MNADFLAILRCPETRQPLGWADAAVLAKVNARIAKGDVTNRGGERVGEAMTAALMREDRILLYPIRDDIPILLVEEAIFL